MKTGLKVTGAVLAALAAIVALTVAGWGLGWFNRGVEIVSVKNVEKQHYQIINDWEALQAAAVNACAATDSETNSKSPTLVESTGLAYEATYRNIAVEYNRRQQNLFEAKIAGPSGYPREAPKTDASTDWCELAESLQ